MSITLRFARLCAVALLCGGSTVFAQNTVGLITHTDGSLDSGYVLFAPLNTNTTYLIDKCGKFIHSWPSQYPPGLCAYLLPDGSVLRGSSITGGGQGGTSVTEKIDWSGKVVWAFVYDSIQGQHHDIEPLPNGNVLIIAHEPHTKAEMLALGRNPKILGSSFLSDKIVELQPTGPTSANVVWEWHPMDHLVQQYDSTKPAYGDVASHPELIDLNFPAVSVGEWLHVNSVKYNPELDQIIVSSHNTSEVWVIDHSTSTSQAAGHTGGRYGKGGDLLYRWGNPAAYKHGTAANQTLFAQHDPQWIRKGCPHAGELMVFNNGVGRPAGLYSSADRFASPVDANGNYAPALPYAPAQPDWTFADTAADSKYSQTMGGAEMLPNGNVSITLADQGIIIEVDSTGSEVWKYVVPVTAGGILAQGSQPTGNAIFKARFYTYSYGAFKGRDLTPGGPIELGPVNYDCMLNLTIQAVAQPPQRPDNQVFVYPNPASDHFTVSDPGRVTGLALYNSLGERVAVADNSGQVNTAALPSGVYYLATRNGASITKTLVTIAK